MQIPRLHPDTIEEVKERVDIYEVVSEHIALKKNGQNYVGLCPFHQEKTPSFSVSPSKQMYYCFGCAKGGGAINFLMEIGKSSFSEVVFNLAKRYQIPIRTLEPEKRQQLQQQITIREQLYEVLAITGSFYQHALVQPVGALALDYLENERKLNQETIQRFQLGYAPGGWETLFHYLVETKKFPVPLVEKAGLIVPRKSGTGYYDRFRERVMIPICDSQGKIIAFGGRTLTDEMPKYLNSPETDLFEKGKTLFAFSHAKNAISQQDKAIVVEGYFDAICLHSVGINNVVASLGTALSSNQIYQLLRYTESKQIILNFDADKAGQNAAQRAIGEIANLAYRGDISLRILNLPEGKDADEYLKIHGVEDYQKLLSNAPLWLDWQIQQILATKDLKQADQYQQATTEIVHLLSQINQDTPLNYYLNYCAEVLSQGDARRVPLINSNLLTLITQECNRILKTEPNFVLAPLIEGRLKINKRPANYQQSSDQLAEDNTTFFSQNELLEVAEAILLQCYIHYPEHRPDVCLVLEQRNLEFSFSHHRILWRLMSKLDPKLEPVELFTTLQQPYLLEEIGDISQISDLFYLDEKKQQDLVRTPLVIRAAAASMERVLCEKLSREFLTLMQTTDWQTNLELAQKYQQQYQQQKNRIKELEQERYTTFNDLVSLPWLNH